MGTKWEMPIAVIGKPTGDGRQFDPGALSHRSLPLPLRYVASDSGGHKDAVIVGHISKIGKEDGGYLPAKGEFYDGPEWPDDVREAATAARMFVGNKVIGPSVDLTQAEMERVPEPKAYAEYKKAQAGKLKAAKMAHGGDCGCGTPVAAAEPYTGPHLAMVRSGEIGSATLVHIPAFAQLSGKGKLAPIDESDPNVDGTSASAMIENDAEMSADFGRKKKKLDPDKVQGNRDDEELALDADEGTGIWLSDDEYREFAKRRTAKAKQLEQPTDDGEQSGGAAYRDMDPNVGGGTDRDKIPSEDFVDPKGRRFPIKTCGDVSDAVSSYGRANPKIPMDTFKARLTAIAKRKGCEGSLPQEWKDQGKMAALMAGGAAKPSAALFANPKLERPTPLTIDDDGRVYGHVAIWDTCHVGLGDSCVKPPKSRTGYAYFHTGETLTAEGERVAVGRLTYGAGHAAANLGYRAAAEHYDDTAHVGAYVRAGEDEHGIWVAGTVAPEAGDDAVRVMRAAPLSGDWRRIGGNLEMVAALHVNTAGFPIPRAVLSSGEPQTLVAAGALHPLEYHQEAGDFGPYLDAEAIGKAIAEGILAEQNRQKARERAWDGLVAAAEEAFFEGDCSRYAESRERLLSALAE